MEVFLLTSKFVGCCKVEVFDKQKDLAFPMLVMYPTDTASKPVAFGPFFQRRRWTRRLHMADFLSEYDLSAKACQAGD
jgi:hypothetical protein